VDSVEEQLDLRTKVDTKQYLCEQCGKMFKTLSLKCGQSFAQLVHFQVHQFGHSGEKTFLCEACGLTFTHLSLLKRHQHTHTGEKPFPCDECGKRFTHTGNLKRPLHLINSFTETQVHATGVGSVPPTSAFPQMFIKLFHKTINIICKRCHGPGVC
uniref:C2H2-type domain-containing protein n=1 Tax=Pundamilia nyererei TaxID=303518 RepID=A0A3B4F1S8_9CICH